MYYLLVDFNESNIKLNVFNKFGPCVEDHLVKDKYNLKDEIYLLLTQMHLSNQIDKTVVTYDTKQTFDKYESIIESLKDNDDVVFFSKDNAEYLASKYYVQEHPPKTTNNAKRIYIDLNDYAKIIDTSDYSIRKLETHMLNLGEGMEKDVLNWIPEDEKTNIFAENFIKSIYAALMCDATLSKEIDVETLFKTIRKGDRNGRLSVDVLLEIFTNIIIDINKSSKATEIYIKSPMFSKIEERILEESFVRKIYRKSISKIENIKLYGKDNIFLTGLNNYLAIN